MATITVRVLDTPIIHNKRYFGKGEVLTLDEKEAARLSLFVSPCDDAPKSESAIKTAKKTQKAA